MLRFRALGAFDVFDGDEPCAPTAPKVLRVLALLVMQANEAVPIDALVDEVWDQAPPASAVVTVQTYIHQLRKAFAGRTVTRAGEEWLVTRPFAYVARLVAEQVDITAFRGRFAQGHRLLSEGRLDAGADALRGALELWSGPALANLPCGRQLRTHAVRLDELRLRALELRIQADLALGRHRELIGELRALVAQYSLNEWFHGRLILALGRSQRRSEALAAYQHLRNILKEQLGLDPHPELQRLHRQVLTGQLDREVRAPASRRPNGRSPRLPVCQPNNDLGGSDARAVRRLGLGHALLPDGAAGLGLAGRRPRDTSGVPAE